MRRQTCLQKIFNNECALFFFYCAVYAALEFSSGGMMCLGSYFLTKTGRQEYEPYNSSAGFKIGIASGAVWNFLIAGIATYNRYSLNNMQDSPPSEKVLFNGVMGGASVSLFALFHHVMLPVVQTFSLGCVSLAKNEKIKHPICYKSDDELYATFFSGFGLVMLPVIGCFMLYVCCMLCSCSHTRSEPISHSEPHTVVSVAVSAPAVVSEPVTAVEMQNSR